MRTRVWQERAGDSRRRVGRRIPRGDGSSRLTIQSSTKGAEANRARRTCSSAKTPNAIDSNWTLVQKITPPYVGCNQRGSFGWNAALGSHASALVISEPMASWEWDYPAQTEYDASRHHLSAGAVHVYTRGQDEFSPPNASWYSLRATIGQGGLDVPTRVGWNDAASTDMMFGAGVAIDEDTLAATCANNFTAVYALTGVPTPWIEASPEPGPWINTLFRDAGTTMASLVVLMGLGPSAALAVAATFFKPL